MKNTITRKDINAIQKTANVAILDEMHSISWCIKAINRFCKSETYENDANKQAVKAWAKTMKTVGINLDDITPELIVSNYKWHNVLNEKECLVRTNIYKVDENCDFMYEEYQKAGRTYFRKIVDFYVFDIKTSWSINDVMTCIANKAFNSKSTEYQRETPYVKGEKMLEVSMNAEHIRRAKDATREEEANQRAINALDAE